MKITCYQFFGTLHVGSKDLMINLISGPYNGMPKKVVGMYILLADDTEPG